MSSGDCQERNAKSVALQIKFIFLKIIHFISLIVPSNLWTPDWSSTLAWLRGCTKLLLFFCPNTLFTPLHHQVPSLRDNSSPFPPSTTHSLSQLFREIHAKAGQHFCSPTVLGPHGQQRSQDSMLHVWSCLFLLEGEGHVLL